MIISKAGLVSVGLLLADELEQAAQKYHVKSDQHDILSYESATVRAKSIYISAGTPVPEHLKLSSILSPWGEHFEWREEQSFIERLKFFYSQCEELIPGDGKHMKPFNKLDATAMPLREENVDTDQVIPAKYLTAVTKEGMGDGLFSAWRYNADGSDNPDFVLNDPVFKGSEILIAGRNFGSGSSREHAVWALTEYGFRAVIAPVFADIFYNNSLKNGLLPIALPEEAVNMLMDLIEEDPTTQLSVNLETQTVTLPDGQTHSFDIDPFRKTCLQEGLDDLGYILAKDDAIIAHEAVPAF